jgi:hypothetical protein
VETGGRNGSVQRQESTGKCDADSGGRRPVVLFICGLWVRFTPGSPGSRGGFISRRAHARTVLRLVLTASNWHLGADAVESLCQRYALALSIIASAQGLSAIERPAYWPVASLIAFLHAVACALIKIAIFIRFMALSACADGSRLASSLTIG